MGYELSIYDQLLQFPLFQGMSHADLMEVAGHTKLGFLKMHAQKKIVDGGDQCDSLYLLTDGQVTAVTKSADGAYSVVESLHAPAMLQPERLFGMNTRYTSGFTTLTDCNFIVIDKQEVVLLLETQLVFRLNMLNVMATKTWRTEQQLWRSLPATLRERVTRFLVQHTLYPAGEKTFYILMQRIADELNASRLDVSRCLNTMQAEGLLTLSRGRIVVPMLERLLM